MAKKKDNKKRTKAVKELDEKVLPQNILQMGERVEEKKNIYITQQTYKEIQKFTSNKTDNESGGMLIGHVLEEFGKINVIITGFIEAKYCDATPTTLKFTHKTWEYVHGKIDKKYPGKKILGWIHTHPDFGIFLSDYDKFIHENFFNEEYQIAYVVDPIQNIEGFYFWIDGKIERCKGFYICDKTDTKIDVQCDAPAQEQDDDDEGGEGSFSFRNVLLVALIIVVIFLWFTNMSQNEEIEKLKKSNEELTQAVAEMQPVIEVVEQGFGMSSIYVEPDSNVEPEQDNPTEVGTAEGDTTTEDVVADVEVADDGT